MPEHSAVDKLTSGGEQDALGQGCDSLETNSIRRLIEVDEDTKRLSPDHLARYGASDWQRFTMVDQARRARCPHPSYSGQKYSSIARS
ncbi:hypothetical protein [Nocardia sp. NPDC048505]|uniref:hypothetical protein n=1 Tax=unclassified Nocardia TaxID=2637762 RepID=UPI0033F61BA1